MLRTLPLAGLTLLMSSCVAPASSAVAAPASAVEPAQPLELDGYSKSRRDRYNRIYAERANQPMAPSAFMLECLGRIEYRLQLANQPPTPDAHPPRAALDIGMGEGRNTIALAQRGYHVTGIDFSDVGVNIARQRAAALGLDHFTTHVTFARDFDYGREQWDVIVLMYFPLDHKQTNRVKDAVRPGGYIIHENSGPDPDKRALQTYMNWEVIIYDQDLGTPDWSQNRPNTLPNGITRMLVRKPW